MSVCAITRPVAWRRSSRCRGIGRRQVHRGGSMCNRSSFFVLAGLTACTFALSAGAQDHQHKMKEPVRLEADARQLVKFPEPMRLHTMISMRDHLFALQEINLALSRNEFDKAASIAEQRLGMSSLERHGASHIATFHAARNAGYRARRCTGRRAGLPSKRRPGVLATMSDRRSRRSARSCSSAWPATQRIVCIECRVDASG